MNILTLMVGGILVGVAYIIGIGYLLIRGEIGTEFNSLRETRRNATNK